MPDPTPPADASEIRFRCPGCRRRFTASPAQVGRSSACPKCQTRVVVPAESEAAADETDFSDMVGVECRLCRTRIYVRPRYIGKRVQCPDCDTLTVVQAPKPQVKPQPPVAMKGRQYEVYEGEEQPWAADLIAAEPTYIDVVCTVCQTLMRAEESAIGSSLTCPDCLTKTVVKRPKKQRKKKLPTKNDPGYAVEKSEPVASTMQTDLYAEALKRPPLGYRSTEEEGKKKVGRPDPPRFGMFNGVMRFWWSGGMIGAWLGLSVGLAMPAILAFIATSSSGLGSLFAMLIGVAFILTPLLALLVWLGAASVIFIELVIESSEGNDKVINWPTIELGVWAGPVMMLLFAGFVSVMPVAIATRVIPGGNEILWIALGAWLVFPWILLSQLEGSSIWCVFSPRLLRTIRWAPGSWFIFYVQTALLDAGYGALALLAEWKLGIWGVFVLAPATVFVFLMYARLLGRLAWIIAAATPDREAKE